MEVPLEPTVTVVIPAYNAAAHLERSVRSALAQTLAPDEILIVDDGSRDATREIAESFGPPVRVVPHDRNRGLAAARNTGIEHAGGEWIALLDADDLWYPPKLERQLAALAAPKRDADVGVVFCLTRIVLPGVSQWIDSAEAPRPQEDREGFRRALLRSNAVSGSGCSPIIRRDLLLRVGGYDAALRTCEDWDLWLRLARTAGFHRVDEVLCEGYARPGGLSLRVPWLLEDAAAVLDRHLPEFIGDPAERTAIRTEALDLVRSYASELVRGADVPASSAV